MDINVTEKRIYFSLPVRDSPFSKDLEIFIQAINSMDFDNPVKSKSYSSVLPNHGTAGHTGIVFGEILDTLTAEQMEYFKQFAFVYDDKNSFETAKKESFRLYCDMTPNPG